MPSPHRQSAHQLTSSPPGTTYVDYGAPPASPAQALLDALDDAATAVTQARAAVDAAEETLAQAVLHAYRSGFTWARIAAKLEPAPEIAHADTGDQLTLDITIENTEKPDPPTNPTDLEARADAHDR